VKYEYEEIKASLELDRGVASNVGWTSLFATVGNRKRMRIIIALAFFSQWSGNGLVSYYLNQVFETIGIKDATVQVRCVVVQIGQLCVLTMLTAPYQWTAPNLEPILGAHRSILGRTAWSTAFVHFICVGHARVFHAANRFFRAIRAQRDHNSCECGDCVHFHVLCGL
jgi:hypothetical protein